MGIGERQAGGAVETGVRGCGRAEVEDRGYAITGQRTTEAKRSTRCKYCFDLGPQSQGTGLNSVIECLRCALVNIYHAT